MTLNTSIFLTGPVDAHELQRFVNTVLLKAPDAETKDEPDTDWQTKEPTGTWSLDNLPGQGFDAWMMITYRPDGELATEDVWDDDDGYRWLAQKKCTVEISFDTPYGGRSRDGLDCTTLHSAYIVALFHWAQERGITLEWQNEYTGDYFEGLNGLEDFGNAGDEAMDWFRNVVTPAIERLITEGQ